LLSALLINHGLSSLTIGRNKDHYHSRQRMPSQSPHSSGIKDVRGCLKTNNPLPAQSADYLLSRQEFVEQQSEMLLLTYTCDQLFGCQSGMKVD
jgi:hypothetical protein